MILETRIGHMRSSNIPNVYSSVIHNWKWVIGDGRDGRKITSASDDLVGVVRSPINAVHGGHCLDHIAGTLVVVDETEVPYLQINQNSGENRYDLE